MSTCPSKDLYSAYVDGEVPSPWKEKLEAHLENCAECRKIEQSYRSLKQKIINSDTPALNLEDSFERLQNRKLSQKIRKETETERPNWFTRSVKIPIPAFAAAAVFLFVFMPIFMVNNQNSRQNIIVSNFEPIMPVQTNMNVANAAKFNLNELNTMNLEMISDISDIERKKRKKIDLNRFINLYLPAKNQEDNMVDVVIVQTFSSDNPLFENFTVTYSNNDK